MGTSCTTLPTISTDDEYGQKQKQNTSQSPKYIANEQTNYEQSIADPKSKTSKNKIPKKRRRKSVRNISFHSGDNSDLSFVFTNKVSNKSDTNMPSFEYTNYNLPNQPIRFTKNCDIWCEEYVLFTETLTHSVFETNKSDKNIVTNLIKIILEFAEIDAIYKLNNSFPLNRGLWPHEYILHNTQTAQNITENGMIIPQIRDQLIQSFNLQNIFEICGNCFSSKHAMNSKFKMSNFFVSGVYNNNDTFAHYSDYEPNDGYTSTAESLTASMISYLNPLRFKIYSHDIMVCHSGFYIEKHNEYYEQSDGDIIAQDSEPTYYFTLLLLPPNIQTYQGGKYRFYGANKCVDIVSDTQHWTWMFFDKRIKYECDAIMNGTAITFKMDIDVWRKSEREMKASEESYERMNELLAGRTQLNIDMNNLNYGSDKMEFEMIDMELSPSPNIVYPPYPILWHNL